MIRKFVLVVAAIAALAVAVPGVAAAQGSPNPMPSWCTTASAGGTNRDMTAVWPSTVVTGVQWDGCYNANMPGTSVLRQFKVNGALTCTGVVVDANALDGFENGAIDEQLLFWLTESAGFVGDLLGWLADQAGARPNVGSQFIYTSCWMPAVIARQLTASGGLRIQGFGVTPGAHPGNQSNCDVPPAISPAIAGLNAFSSSLIDCMMTVAQPDGSVRLHSVTSTSFGGWVVNEGIGAMEVALAPPQPCVITALCRGMRLSLAEPFELGHVTDDGVVLPSTPAIPPWIDPATLSDCKVINFTGDDVNATTWAGGETVDFEAVWKDGAGTRAPFPATITVVLGETNGEEVRAAPQVVNVPAAFSVTVPELSEPLTPRIVFEVNGQACQTKVWYDPSGEGGPPGSTSGVSTFSECVDDGLGDRLPEPSGGFTDVVMTAAKWTICGIYILFVPERGFAWHFANAQFAVRETAFGDLVTVWSLGSNVLRDLSSAPGATSAADITIAGSTVSIPAPDGEVIDVFRIGLSVMVLLGAGLFGLRMVFNALGGATREATYGGRDEE